MSRKHTKAGRREAFRAHYNRTANMAWLTTLGTMLAPAFARQEDAPMQMSGEGWSGQMTTTACPVQIEGTADGLHFYFRARWDSWRCSFAPTPEGAVGAVWEDNGGSWSIDGDAEEDGSWMPHSEAWRHVEESIAAWRSYRSTAVSP